MRHILSTLEVNNWLLPYSDVITKNLQHFRVPFSDLIYEETKKTTGEAITGRTGSG